MTKISFNELKPDDKFTVEATIVKNDFGTNLITFRLKGSDDTNASYRQHTDQVIVDKITPPKTTVEVRDRFQSGKYGSIYEIRGVDKNECWYTSKETGSSAVCNVRYFLTEDYKFLGNVNDKG